MGYIKVSEKSGYILKVVKILNSGYFLILCNKMMTTRRRKIKKLKGNLGKLLDEVAANSGNPVGDLERIAQLALDDGSLNEREYEILQYRIPFPSYVRKPSIDEAVELGGIERERVRQLEGKIYVILKPYLSGEQEVDDVHELGLHRLPWRKMYKGYGILVYNKLIRGLSDKGMPLTVGSAVKLFEETKRKGETLQTKTYYKRKRNYGEIALKTTYDVFRAVGVELAEVKASAK